MSFQHGRLTEIMINPSGPPVTGGTDLSQFVDTSEFPRTADTHDVTTYGKAAHVYSGGLKDATFTMGGVYDNAASGTPRVVLEGNTGAKCRIRRRPEGTGSGKPNQEFDGVLNNYTESNPVADMVRWTAEFQVSDAVILTSQ